MSQVRTFPGDRPVDMAHCWALWREDLPCPNVATWRVQNTTNAGYSLMCDVHKDGFMRAHPAAAVTYVAVGVGA
jgi:hypothetical protein